MKCHTREEIEKIAIKGAIVSIVASGLVIGLLIWGKLQLKEVPRTAEALPEQRQTTPPPSLPHGNQPQILQPAPTSPEAEKSHTEPADDTHAAQAAGSSMVLEDIIGGNPPTAVINGQTIAAGQEIDGYVLREIKQDRVILEKDAAQIELEAVGFQNE